MITLLKINIIKAIIKFNNLCNINKKIINKNLKFLFFINYFYLFFNMYNKTDEKIYGTTIIHFIYKLDYYLIY